MQNDTKKQNKRQKRTHTMGADMLRVIREEIRFAPRDMYRHLGIPRRTYQDYEAGKRGIPEVIARAVITTLKWNQEFKAGMDGRVDAIERGEKS